MLTIFRIFRTFSHASGKTGAVRSGVYFSVLKEVVCAFPSKDNFSPQMVTY